MTSAFPHARLLTLLVTTLLGCTAAYAASPDTPSPSPAAKSPDSVASNYGEIPLSFEANHGQTDKRVKFLSHGSGYSLFLTDQEAVLALRQVPNCPATTTSSMPRKKPAPCETSRQDLVRMGLAGAHPTRSAAPTGEDPLPGKVNYFLGNDPSKWLTDLPTYARVKYAGIYDGIDLVYYGNQRQLEYDFIVAPGTNPASIRLHFTGQQHLRVTPTGDLILNGAHGQATLLKPLIYQEPAQTSAQPSSSSREIIPGAFHLTANHTVTFQIGKYDRTRPLIIDPILVYSTYLGGTGWIDPDLQHFGDQGYGITSDSAGNAYVVGSAYSSDFPITAEAYQSIDKEATGSFENKGNGSSVFISKLNPTGTALLYSTYLGGSGQNISGYGLGDFGNAIALDSSNNVYVTGYTFSADFPVTVGAYQMTPPQFQGFTAFAAKLNSTGNSLVYSTFLGGNNPGWPFGTAGNAIAVDAGENAYVAGYTSSYSFPVTSGAFQTQLKSPGGTDNANAFVTKLNPTGTGAIYSTYLGGSGINYLGTGFRGDSATGIAIDKPGDAFVTGFTYSSDFPVTLGAFQTTNPSFSN